MAIYIPKDPKVSYAGGDMASLAKEYHQVIESIDKDNRYANLFESYKGVLRDDRHSKALKDFFVSNIVEEADPIRGEKFHLFTGYFIQSICLFICYYIKQYNY